MAADKFRGNIEVADGMAKKIRFAGMYEEAGRWENGERLRKVIEMGHCVSICGLPLGDESASVRCHFSKSS